LGTNTAPLPLVLDSQILSPLSVPIPSKVKRDQQEKREKRKEKREKRKEKREKRKEKREKRKEKEDGDQQERPCERPLKHQ